MSSRDDEHRRAEEALRRSEARFAGILEIAAEAIISIDESQRITLFNEGAETIFGYERTEVLGQSLEILIPDRYRSTHAAHVTAFGAASGAARRMGERQEILGRRKDGTEFSAEASISKLDLFGERTFTVVLRDVSERKATEAALRESERRLWAFLDNSSVVGWMKDEGGRFVFLSGNFQRRFGSRFDNWAGKTDFDFWPRHVAEKFRSSDLGVMESGHGTEVLEEAISPDGQRSWWLMHKFPFQDAEGRRFVGGLGIDITRRVQAEDALAQSHHELEARVDERTRELRDELLRNQDQQAAIARLQRMEAIGQLTGGIAHDFNNLLTVISGNLQLMGMESLDPRLQKYLDEAERAAGMGARLNQRLMTFAKQRRLAPVPVNLNEQVIAVRELLRRTIGENILLSADLADDLWTVRADPSEIENALVNLAINARDAMPDGGKLALSTENVSIGSESEAADGGPPPGQYVKLAVSDTGTGMTPEVKAHVFEPFFTTKGQGKGTGLGLATIYGFVTQSGGHITLSSEPGRGTAFSIYLPRLEAGRAEDRRSEASLQGLPAQGERILVVEDDEAVRRVTVERLRSLGYRTLVAASGQEAIDLLAGGAQADLVFSDIVMPGKLSGFDLMRYIERNMPHLKVLLTSGYAPNAASAPDGADVTAAILAKPYSQEALAQAISDALHS